VRVQCTTRNICNRPFPGLPSGRTERRDCVIGLPGVYTVIPIVTKTAYRGHGPSGTGFQASAGTLLNFSARSDLPRAECGHDHHHEGDKFPRACNAEKQTAHYTISPPPFVFDLGLSSGFGIISHDGGGMRVEGLLWMVDSQGKNEKLASTM
jgi:hypothetical protein